MSREEAVQELKYIYDSLVSCDGQINYAKAEILINDDCPTSLKEESLCHEILHGLLIHIGREDLSADETFVQSLSNAIYGSFAVREVDDGKIHSTADVRENVKGKWVDWLGHGKEWECSVCKCSIESYGSIAYNFCPMCGADMRPRLQGTEIDGAYIDISGDGTVIEQI